MTTRWQPLVTMVLDHAAFDTSPLRLAADAATQTVMTQLSLRADTWAAPGTTAIYYASVEDGLGGRVTPVLHAAQDAVLTFAMASTVPNIHAITDLRGSDAGLIRWYSNAGTGGSGANLGLLPAIGKGVAAQGDVLDVTHDGVAGVVDVVRVLTDVVAAQVTANAGRIQASLAGLAAGCYALRHRGRTLQRFVLLPAFDSTPFGLVEVALRASSVRAPHRILQGTAIHPRVLSATLPARRCYVSYAIYGLDDPAATITCSDPRVIFGVMSKTQMNGVTGLRVTSAKPIAMDAYGPEYTLNHSFNGTQRAQRLPQPNASKISLQHSASGDQWVVQCAVYL